MRSSPRRWSFRLRTAIHCRKKCERNAFKFLPSSLAAITTLGKAYIRVADRGVIIAQRPTAFPCRSLANSIPYNPVEDQGRWVQSYSVDGVVEPSDSEGHSEMEAVISSFPVKKVLVSTGSMR
jgi:hypothetical protein